MKIEDSHVVTKERNFFLFDKPLLFWSIVILVVAIFVGSYFYRFSGPNWVAGGPATWGEFGDYLGGVLGPVLAFITVIILVHTLHLQRRELEVTRSHARADRLLKIAGVLEAKLETAMGWKIKVYLEQKPGYGTRLTQYHSADLQQIIAKDVLTVHKVMDPARMIAGRKTLELMHMADGTSEWDHQMHETLGRVLGRLIDLNGLIAALRKEPDTEAAADHYIRCWSSVSQGALVHGYLKAAEIPALLPMDEFTQRVKHGYRIWKRGNNGEFESTQTVQESTARG